MSTNETGLMKKTKAQLVEIILRKDDEEIRLKNAYEAAKEEVKKSEENAKRLTNDLNKANANVQQHQSGMDELTSQKVAAEDAARKFEQERNTHRNWNYVLGIAIILIVAAWIIF